MDKNVKEICIQPITQLNKGFLTYLTIIRYQYSKNLKNTYF